MSGRGVRQAAAAPAVRAAAHLARVRRLIREFEREARTDGMPANELNFRKKQYVQELNGFIGLKKAYSGAVAQRSELLDGAKSEAEKVSGVCADRNGTAVTGALQRPSSGARTCSAGMNTTELMQLGRQQVKETDASLLRSEKIVNDTMAIGIQTAETLQGQTRQLEKVGQTKQ